MLFLVLFAQNITVSSNSRKPQSSVPKIPETTPLHPSKTC